MSNKQKGQDISSSHAAGFLPGEVSPCMIGEKGLVKVFSKLPKTPSNKSSLSTKFSRLWYCCRFSDKKMDI